MFCWPYIKSMQLFLLIITAGKLVFSAMLSQVSFNMCEFDIWVFASADGSGEITVRVALQGWNQLLGEKGVGQGGEDVMGLQNLPSFCLYTLKSFSPSGFCSPQPSVTSLGGVTVRQCDEPEVWFSSICSPLLNRHSCCDNFVFLSSILYVCTCAWIGDLHMCFPPEGNTAPLLLNPPICSICHAAALCSKTLCPHHEPDHSSMHRAGKMSASKYLSVWWRSHGAASHSKWIMHVAY